MTATKVAIPCPSLLALPNDRVIIGTYLYGYRGLYRPRYIDTPPRATTGICLTTLSIECVPGYTEAFRTLPLISSLRTLTLKVSADDPNARLPEIWRCNELHGWVSQLDGLRHLEVDTRLLPALCHDWPKIDVPCLARALPPHLEVLGLVDISRPCPVDGDHGTWFESVISWLKALATERGGLLKSLVRIRMGVERAPAIRLYVKKPELEDIMRAGGLELEIYDL